MEIKTKFRVGDLVFIIDSNKVHQVQVKRIEIWVEDKATIIYHYTIDGLNKKGSESSIFSSREELLNSL